MFDDAQLWPGRSAVGRYALVDGRPHEIVGVAQSAQYRAITEAAVPYVYLNYWQQPESGGWPADSRTHVRIDGDAATLLPIIRREIAAIDLAVPLSEDYPLDTRVAYTFRPVRMAMVMLVSFGSLAIVLTAVGLYGMVTFATNLRRREIAIRMALGARPDQVRTLVLNHGMKLVLGGGAIGLAGAAAGSRVLSTLLYGVQPYDAATFVCVAALLTTVTYIAGSIPARRAMRVDPALTLRQE